MDEVIIDFNPKKALQPGSFYTALSRVKFGDKFYLRTFQPQFINANPEVQTKLLNMERFAPYSFKKVYLDSFIYETSEEIKIGYININSLFSSMSHVFLNNDQNLLRLDLLCVADTRLTSEHDDTELKKHLENWNILSRYDSSDQISHMGLLLLSSKRSQYEDMLSEVKIRVVDDNEHNFVQMQAIKLEIEGWNNLKLGFFYVRVTPTWEQLAMLSLHFANTDILMADMNLDPRREDDLRKLNGLCGLTRKRILHENTTSRLNQLDHIFLRTDLAPSAFSTSFINHSTDHRTITVRIPLQSSSEFSEDFKKDWHFNKEQWTRKRKICAPKYEEFTCDFSEQTTIDQYLDVIKTNSLKESIVFDTAFAESGFENGKEICARYQNIKIISAEAILIPFYYSEKQKNAVVICSKETFKVYWPYNATDESTVELAEGVIKFLKQLYSIFDEEFPEVKDVTLVHCPSKLEVKDYWIYLLTAMKKYVLLESFDEEKFDVKKELVILERELRSQKLFQNTTPYKQSRSERAKPKNKPNPKTPSSQKRSHSPDRSSTSPETALASTPKKSKETLSKNLLKTFQNRDNVSCWLNSSIQVSFSIVKNKTSNCKLFN